MDSVRIPFNKPFIVGNELSYIAEAALQNAHISGDGPFTAKCQEWLENKTGCVQAFLTHSCTAALEMAAILCDISPGDEVIMPSFTFVSTANPFVLRGAVPVFTDIRPDTLNIDERLIEASVTPRTRAIVPVHYAGVACEMDEILRIAEKYGLYVVEDAAQALLSTYHGKMLGTLGNLGCLSFHETKNIISGEGGALIINDSRLVERASVIRQKGTNRSAFLRGETDKYTWVDIGSSFLPSDITGAFLFAQFEEAEKICAKRRLIHRWYIEGLQSLEQEGCIRLPFFNDACVSNGHIFHIITGSVSERAHLISYLREHGIMAVFHYIPLHSSPAGLRYSRSGSALNVTDDLSARVLRLPMYYTMDENDVRFVSETMMSFYHRQKCV